MIIIEPSVYIEQMPTQEEALAMLERAGRVCYKSEHRITEGSAERFVNAIISLGHESVLEHVSASVRIVCDRGVSHELVRHRIASYSQESTRYCNYSNERFGGEITFIRPFYYEEGSKELDVWEKAMDFSERYYFKLLKMGSSPQEARAVLPNSLKTEIIATMNLREWRHFFTLRLSKKAHPQMVQIASLIFDQFEERIPLLVKDIVTKIH